MTRFASRSPHGLVVMAALACASASVLYVTLNWTKMRHTAAPEKSAGFREVADAAGIEFQMNFLPAEQGETFRVNLYDHGCGVAVADYDGDGDDDVLFLNQLGANALYRNRGDGTFEDVTSQNDALALADRVCVGASFADIDNDGDQDLYITSTRGGNVLFENQGHGRFCDITARAGVGITAHSQTPAFFDYDNDGDLDLLVTNSARWTTDEFDSRLGYYRGTDDLWSRIYNVADREENVLFRNDGGLVFSDVTREAGLGGNGWSGDVAIFDYDEDGDWDVFITNMFGLSRLYQNDGHGKFQDVTTSSLGTTSMGAIGVKALDYNCDGRLDLFIADMHSDMWVSENESFLVEPRKKYENRSGPKGEANRYASSFDRRVHDKLGADFDGLVFGNTLFRNDGGGRFSEVSEQAGVETFWPWGVAVGDFNNDGYEDLFLPSGMGFPYFYWPNALLMNGPDGVFANRSAQEGIEPPPRGRTLPDRIAGRPAVASSRCAATADFDSDGRLDLIVNNFNGKPYYFKNQFPTGHYVQFRLRGTKSNRDAVGALVKLYCGRRVMVRQVQAAGGYLSQSSKTLHFGLAESERIDRAEIRWPSGRRQTMEAPNIDTLIEIVENSDEAT